MKKKFFTSEKTYIGSIFTSFWRNISNFFRPKKNSRKFLALYLFAVAIGAILLYMPFSLTSYIKSNGEAFSIVDAIFTSTSAFSDTGLVVTQTSKQFTIFGQIVILILILLGGIGIMSLKIILFTILSKKFGLKDRIMIRDERGSSKIGETTELVISAFKTILGGILFGTIALTPYFYLVKQEINNLPTYKNFFISLWHALFHSVSAINNAGFDITGGKSLLPYANDLWVQLVFILLIVIGGIGFPVIHDLKRFIKHKKKRLKNEFKWSLFTKLTVVIYFLVFVFGLCMTLFLEISTKDPGSLWNMAKSGKIIYDGIPITRYEALNGMIFSVFSTRNAGFSTLPVSIFQDSTKLVWSVLMWIGSSPASTAGGIRTTTIAIATLAVISSWRGSNRVFVFRHRIPQKTVQRSLFVVITSIALVSIATIIIILDTHNSVAFLTKDSTYIENIIFEVASAFGTTGLSTGITSLLGSFSLGVLVILMMFGQLGISTALSVFAFKKETSEVSEIVYGEEDVIIS